jgi:hypothetical protein
MRKMILAASILALASGGAIAQTTAPSSADKPGAAGQSPTTDPKQTSPGTTGAMNNAVGGVATSPQDVREQQKGATPSGKGDTNSPGTVGATPGDDPAQPKQK